MAAVPTRSPKYSKLILDGGPPVAAMPTRPARASGWNVPACTSALGSAPGIDELREPWGATKQSSDGSRVYMAPRTSAMARKLLLLRLAMVACCEDQVGGSAVAL
eukprot:TRINITY_DN2360_c0_g1_i9.p2 TRINITY_DN2360_c0_g1~~TRINITY_DN2360_c0_g1_i9.p2  ORF type:complete len:105 (+),score=20.70 TRINITY_DN2360_c0_g1_i9:255-569(+)